MSTNMFTIVKPQYFLPTKLNDFTVKHDKIFAPNARNETILQWSMIRPLFLMPEKKRFYSEAW